MRPGKNSRALFASVISKCDERSHRLPDTRRSNHRRAGVARRRSPSRRVGRWGSLLLKCGIREVKRVTFRGVPLIYVAQRWTLPVRPRTAGAMGRV